MAAAANQGPAHKHHVRELEERTELPDGIDQQDAIRGHSCARGGATPSREEPEVSPDCSDCFIPPSSDRLTKATPARRSISATRSKRSGFRGTSIRSSPACDAASSRNAAITASSSSGSSGAAGAIVLAAIQTAEGRERSRNSRISAGGCSRFRVEVVLKIAAKLDALGRSAQFQVPLLADPALRQDRVRRGQHLPEKPAKP